MHNYIGLLFLQKVKSAFRKTPIDLTSSTHVDGGEEREIVVFILQFESESVGTNAVF